VRRRLITAARLRDATVAWAALLGEFMAVGLRPYLELSHGDSEDDLRLFCEIDDDLLLDISLADEGFPDRLLADEDRYWLVIVQNEDGYLAEVTFNNSPQIGFEELVAKAVSVLEAVAEGSARCWRSGRGRTTGS
jgi:hypothetical protein